MSFYYKIDFFAHLRNDVQDSDLSMIQYLFGLNLNKPIIYPVHSYFSETRTVEPFKVQYDGYFSECEYICKYWKIDEGKNSCHAVRLSLPSMKGPVQWEFLELIDWISTLCTEKGFVGTMTDDAKDQNITLLYVYDKKLFFGIPKKFEITAMTSGEKRMENIWTE